MRPSRSYKKVMANISPCQVPLRSHRQRVLIGYRNLIFHLHASYMTTHHLFSKWNYIRFSMHIICHALIDWNKVPKYGMAQTWILLLVIVNIDDLVQDCSISSAYALEIQQSCTQPSKWYHPLPLSALQIVRNCKKWSKRFPSVFYGM